MPTKTDKAALATNETWRVLFLIPVCLMSIALILNILVFRYDSVEYHVENAEKDKAIELLKCIYPKEKKHIHEQIYNDLRS